MVDYRVVIVKLFGASRHGAIRCIRSADEIDRLRGIIAYIFIKNNMQRENRRRKCGNRASNKSRTEDRKTSVVNILVLLIDIRFSNLSLK